MSTPAEKPSPCLCYEAASSEELHEAYEHTDTSCVEEYENAIEHDVTSAEAGGRPVEVHTWQAASNQLTGRMIDVVSNDIFPLRGRLSSTGYCR